MKISRVSRFFVVPCPVIVCCLCIVRIDVSAQDIEPANNAVPDTSLYHYTLRRSGSTTVSELAEEHLTPDPELPECLSDQQNAVLRIMQQIKVYQDTTSAAYHDLRQTIFRTIITEIETQDVPDEELQQRVDAEVCKMLRIPSDASSVPRQNKLVIHICDSLVQTGKVYYQTDKACKLQVTLERKDTTVTKSTIKLAVSVSDSKHKVEKSYVVTSFGEKQHLQTDSLPDGKYEITATLGKEVLKQNFFTGSPNAIIPAKFVAVI